MTTSIKLKASGLTLIEMMLVITVFAVASLSVLKIIKNRASMQLVNSTAAQMQNVAQAALSYYMAHTSSTAALVGYNVGPNTPPTVWPSTSSTPTSLNNTLVQDHYVSVYTLCTPFPGAGSTACGGRGEIQGQAFPYIQGSSNPFHYNLVLQINSATIATAIASKLANATVSGSTITMSLTAPSTNIYWNPNHGWIVSAGAISTTAEWRSPWSSGNYSSMGIQLPNCGPNFEGHLIFAPFRYQSAGSVTTVWGFHIAQTNGQGGSSDSGNVNDQTSSVIFRAKAADGTDGYAVNIGDDYSNTPEDPNPTDQPPVTIGHLVYFISICVPLGHWYVNGIVPGTNNAYRQDGQCGQSWEQFLGFSNPNYNPSFVPKDSSTPNTNSPCYPTDTSNGKYNSTSFNMGVMGTYWAN